MKFLKIHLQANVLICLALALGAAGAITAARAEAVSDVMVGYSKTWRLGVGGTDQANAAIYNQFGGANNVAAASGAPHRLNVIGTKESDFDAYQQTDCGGMIGWLRDYNVNVRDVVDMGNYLGADLFTYIGDMVDNGAAAQAEQPGRFSCFEQQYLYYLIVAHETGGHNFGLDHGEGRTGPTTIMMHNYCGGGSQGLYSNPHIWQNGTQLIGGMADIYNGGCRYVGGADSAYHTSTTAQGKADTAARRVWGSYRGNLTYRWQFNKPAGAAPAGTVIATDDAVPAKQAIVRGQGATFTGTALRLPGGTTGNTAANSIAAYLDLPNGMFSAMTNFTIEIWAAPRSAENWMRVIDIGRTTEAGDGLGAAGEYTGTAGSAAPGGTTAYDDIMLTASIGSSLNTQRFEAKLGGAGTMTADSALATTAGELHHYAITFADTTTGGTIKWFRDGVLIKTLAVTFHSASLHDVNNWLGRSMYSGDAMANMDYYDVRIQGVALADGEIAGNYRIGTNDKVVTMWANDGFGNSAFVNGAWEFGQTIPDAAHDYEVGTLLLRSPRNATNSTFPGRSLTITGGNLNLDATGAKTTTINDLRLNGAVVGAYGDNGSVQTLAGNITVPTNSNNQVRGGGSPLVISATITGGVGGGGLTYTENPVTLTGNNSGYFGATVVGDGRFSTLLISSEENLGGNPNFYGGAWLQLNRGILQTTQTMTIDDANRGILIGPSGGFFRPNAGTTLTIASPVNSPAAGNTLQTAPLSSNPTLGILFVDGAGTVIFTNPNNSHNAEMQINAGELRLTGSGRLNNGNHSWPITINALFTDNSALDQTLGGAISGNGTIVKSNTSTLSLNGANTFSGSVTINGGTLYANPGNAANNRALSYAGAITVNNGGTLRAGPNGLFGWDGTQEKPITVNTGGILTTNGGLTTDVGIGTVTLAGGTLATLASGSTDYGSFRFDDATDKLLVTQDSTVSATNVKFGNAAAMINVAAGKMLNFTGTVTDTTSGGISYLTKSTGTGTLILTNTNTYTGATAINAGTLKLNGSLAAGSAVTVASGATLSGTGKVNGSLTFAAGSTHAPGDAIGTQTVVGALSYANTTRVKWTLSSNSNATGAASRVTAGAVTITAGAAIDLILNASGSTTNYFDTFWTQPRSWTVVSSSGMTGTFALGTISADAGGRAAASYGSFSFTQSASGTTLNWTPKPFGLWRGVAFGANAGNATMSDFLANPDGDGLANAWEYFYNTNPTTGTSSPLLPQIVGNRATLIFPRNTAATDVLARIQGADALNATWTDLAQSTGAPFAPLVGGVTVNETAGGATNTVTFTDLYLTTDPAHPQRFFRLWIQQP